MKKTFWVFAAALVFLTLSSQAVAAEEGELEALRKRIQTLERRTEELEKDVRIKHEKMLEEMQWHMESLERRLGVVDYRSGRMKAMEEQLEAVSIGGDLSLFLQGFSNGKEETDTSYSGDVFLIAPAGRYGNVYFRGDVGEGEGLSRSLPVTFTNANADWEFNEARFEVVEAWYWNEFPLPDIRDRRLELSIGKMDPTAIFDGNRIANSETNQFMGQAFVNNLAIDWGGDENWYGPGAALGYRFTSIYDKSLKVVGRVGVFEGDGNSEDTLNKPFVITELDVWKPYYGLDGNYRFYAWVNKSDHADLEDPGKDGLSNYGIGLSIDQEISTDAALFARYGVQNKDVSRFDQSFSLGGQVIGNAWKRGNDRIGIAYGASHVSSKYKKANPGIEGRYEHHFELYYKYWANENLSISPDIQYIVNPAGDAGQNDVLVYGVRMQLTF